MANVRVPGGFTVFHWNNEVIGYADEVRVTSVRPVADAQVIQPMNALRPLEIATPRAHGAGTIVLVLIELYNQTAWGRLAELGGTNDIIDIMERVAALNNGVSVTKYVRPPRGNDYSETFYNCVVTDLADNENIRIDTMPLAINKELTLMYTWSMKSVTGANAKPATFN